MIIIDCELVGFDEKGQPDFRTLMSRRRDCDLCLCCFDFLAVDRRPLAVDRRPTLATLLDRRKLLHQLVKGSGERALQFSQHFDSAPGLLLKDQPITLGMSAFWVSYLADLESLT